MKFSINGVIPKQIILNNQDVETVTCTGGGGKWPITSANPIIWKLVQYPELSKTELIDWPRMYAEAGGKATVCNNFNTATQIVGKGGQDIMKGAFYWKQSWKTHDAITIEFSQDACKDLFCTSWTKQELLDIFAAGGTFNMIGRTSVSNHGLHWSIKASTSTDLYWDGKWSGSENCTLVSIKNGYYGVSGML